MDERQRQAESLPGIDAVDVAGLSVKRNGHGATPVGLWLVGDGSRSAELDGERKLLASGAEAGELTSGEWLGHVWSSFTRDARQHLRHASPAVRGSAW